MIEQPQGEKPALIVVIQSWWTPALAVVMLVIGLLAGFFGRPLITKGSGTGTGTTDGVAAVNTPSVTQSVNITPLVTSSVDPTMAAISSQQQLMDYLVSHTTHFQGDASATVTIIEFSDYQ